MNVGERIRYFRQKQDLTVNGLAYLAGVSQSHLRDIELGNKQPTIEYLSYICDALKITLEQFFTDEEKQDKLTAMIKSLNDEQKNALIAFLEAMKATL